MKNWLKHNEMAILSGSMVLTLAVACAFLGYGLTMHHNADGSDGMVNISPAGGNSSYRPISYTTSNGRNPMSGYGFQNEAHSLPAVLSEADRLKYKAIFALQDQGKWKEAIELSHKLDDKILLGHVLAERYLSRDYHSNYDDLAEWVDNYSDHPMAGSIYSLESRKAPKHARLASYQPQPVLKGYGDSNGLSGHMENDYANLLNWSDRPEAEALWNQIHEYVRQGLIAEAHDMVNSKSKSRLFKAVEQDIMLTHIAMGYFYTGHDSEAFAVARRAAARSGNMIPASYRVAGLSAWRMGKMAVAADNFAKAAANEDQSPWARSAGAFWAYRSYRNSGDMVKSEQNLHLAASFPRTFYGILARTVLGQSLDVDATPLAADDMAMQDMLDKPEVKRATALVEVGQRDLAEDEIRLLAKRVEPEQFAALTSVASRLGLPAVEMRLARNLLNREDEDNRYDFARYPVLPVVGSGLRIDPALMFAFIREESGFNPDAVSTAGAKGMMQIMPSTARHVAKIFDINYRSDSDLFDPAVNLSIGQSYVLHLQDQPEVGDNLFYLLAAYNAGPGNLARWQKNLKFKNDPLLFVESIPLRETQNYVKQVAASYWIYKTMAGENNASMQAAASSQWPTL